MEDPFHDIEGGVIANMDEVLGKVPKVLQEAEDTEKEYMDKESDPDRAAPTISSPGKINHTTSDFINRPNAPSEGQQDIICNMLHEWVEAPPTAG